MRGDIGLANTIHDFRGKAWTIIADGKVDTGFVPARLHLHALLRKLDGVLQEITEAIENCRVSAADRLGQPPLDWIAAYNLAAWVLWRDGVAEAASRRERSTTLLAGPSRSGLATVAALRRVESIVLSSLRKSTASSRCIRQ